MDTRKSNSTHFSILLLIQLTYHSLYTSYFLTITNIIFDWYINNSYVGPTLSNISFLYLSSLLCASLLKPAHFFIVAYVLSLSNYNSLISPLTHIAPSLSLHHSGPSSPHLLLPASIYRLFDDDPFPNLLVLPRLPHLSSSRTLSCSFYCIFSFSLSVYP